MKSISEADVERVADLARIALDESQKETAAKQLGDILQAFERLQKLDLTDVEPMAHAVPRVNVWREDASRPSSPKADVLANAPEAEDGLFRVPRILE